MNKQQLEKESSGVLKKILDDGKNETVSKTKIKSLYIFLMTDYLHTFFVAITGIIIQIERQHVFL